MNLSAQSNRDLSSLMRVLVPITSSFGENDGSIVTGSGHWKQKDAFSLQGGNNQILQPFESVPNRGIYSNNKLVCDGTGDICTRCDSSSRWKSHRLSCALHRREHRSTFNITGLEIIKNSGTEQCDWVH